MRTQDATWLAAYAWDRTARLTGCLALVFANPAADFFDHLVPEEWRDAAWNVIHQTPHLTWQLLTKRPHNIMKMLPWNWGDSGWANVRIGVSVEDMKTARARIPTLSMPLQIRRYLLKL